MTIEELIKLQIEKTKSELYFLESILHSSDRVSDEYCKYCNKTPCERKGISIYPEDDE